MIIRDIGFVIDLTIQKTGVRGSTNYVGLYFHSGDSHSYSIPVVNLTKPFDTIGVRVNISLEQFMVDIISPSTDIYIEGVHVEGVSI